MSLRPTREAATRELLEEIEAAGAAAPTLIPVAQPVGFEQFWSASEIAEYRAFQQGGPLPRSAGALELLATRIKLEHEV
jgi:hypothetical protein